MGPNIVTEILGLLLASGQGVLLEDPLGQQWMVVNKLAEPVRIPHLVRPAHQEGVTS